MDTLPPPMTHTRLPVKSGEFPSPTPRRSSTALMTLALSSPSRPSFLSVWAPMAIYTASKLFWMFSMGRSFPMETPVRTEMPADRMWAMSRSRMSWGRR